MMARCSLVALLGAFLSFALSAQGGPLVVDALNRPGTDFRSIRTALRSVPPGQVLLVRAADYDEPAVITRGVTILAEPGTRLIDRTLFSTPRLTITGVPRGEAVRIQNLTLGRGSEFGPLLVAQYCFGEIVLENCSAAGSSFRGFGPSGSAVEVSVCRSLLLNRCRFVDGVPALRAETSWIVASDCEFRGQRGIARGGSAPGGGIDAIACTIELSRCDVASGASDWAGQEHEPGIRSISTDLRITGTASGAGIGRVTAGAGTLPQSAIVGDGRVWVHPNVLLVPSGGAPPVSGVTLQPWRMPSLAASGSPPGGTVAIDVASDPGEVALLLFGSPAFPQPLQGGRLWLETGSLFVGASASLDASGRFAWQFTAPNTPTLLGVRLAVQAWCGTSVATGRFSNPVGYLHGW